MNGDFVENLKGQAKDLKKQALQVVARVTGKPVRQDASVVSNKSESSYEINLVPAVKAEMIKALKIRNVVLFVCIVVSVVAVGVVLVLLGIKGGQDIVMATQDGKLEKLSEVLNSYDELDDLVMIQGQLAKYDELSQSKQVPSRVFGALGVMLPQGENTDLVKMSELRVNMASNLVYMEGQADARVAPLIDYRVLESFKKGMDLTKYDYGRYLDIDGKEIPTQCLTEADEEGNALRIGDSYYAWWDLTMPGCEGVLRSEAMDHPEVQYHYGTKAEVQTVRKETVTETVCEMVNYEEVCKDVSKEVIVGEEVGEDEEPMRLRIWRTPQFDKWYEAGEMTLAGEIRGVEHFGSACYTYSGSETLSGKIRWTSENNCTLAPEGLQISNSSNGRDESDNLVLRFTASVVFDEEFFAFKNKHMIAIGPMGQNVTDSFMQVGNMFTQEAEACDPDDKECLAANS